MNTDSRSDATAHIDRARILVEMGHCEEAITCCEMAIKKDAENVEAHSGKADALAELQMHEKAVQCYDGAIRMWIEQGGDRGDGAGLGSQDVLWQGIIACSTWSV